MAEKTPEQIEEERKAELRRQAGDAEFEKKEPGIFGAIIDFITFLFESFFGNTEAPNENGSVEQPETVQQRVQATQLIINSQAIPHWRTYMEAHKGEAVRHISPVRGDSVVTSDFGDRDAPTAGASTKHNGVDFGKRGDDTIVATAGGIVLFAGEKSGYGKTVIIGHANGTQTLYGHMTGENMPALGIEVKQGDAIGIMGKTGLATGVHLHYEQRKGTTVLEPMINGKPLKDNDPVKVSDNQFSNITLPAGLTHLVGAHSHDHAHEDTQATIGNAANPASRVAEKT